jgi:GxxExxY protein
MLLLLLVVMEKYCFSKSPEIRKMTIEIWCREECYQLQGAVFEVYREMGCGFLEAVYQECMEKELSKRGIPFIAQQELKLFYKGELLKQTFMPDFICHEAIIVELKALTTTTPTHKAKVLNYLKATGIKLGLLVNFGCYPKATVERIML